jgi:hypothetical protein
MNVQRVPGRIATLLALLACVPAQAQLFRAYLESTGSDANPCTVQQPCRLLPAALAAVADGGEIWMLDSANYNTAQVDVTKSVTILAVPGALGGLVATAGGAGIFINAPGVKVGLRNLVIVHLTSSTYGVNFTQGAELHVSGCEISGMQGSGIFAGPAGSKITVKDSVLRNNTLYGMQLAGDSTAAIDRVQLRGNGSGILATTARVTIANSVITGNFNGVHAFANASQPRIAIEGSVLSGNAYGVYATSSQAGDLAEVQVSRSVLVNNTTAAIYASQGALGTVTIVAGGNTMTENTIGFAGTAASTIYTRGTNTLAFNGNDIVTVSLTALAAQ